MDEGSIKFQCNWNKTPPFPEAAIASLNQHRSQLYQIGLIGAYDNGIGFGNISQRHQQLQFFISGSATGNFSLLNQAHYALVTHFDIDQNLVSCEGPIQASSESMSHAVIYQSCPAIQAVIHIHSMPLWEKHIDQLPTTAREATYGTPEMAREIIRLLQQTTVAQKEKCFVMGGHPEGLIAFGETLPAAFNTIRQLQIGG